MRQRFIQSFSTSGTEQEALVNGLLGKPYICFIEDGQYIDWNTLSPTPPEPVYSAMPLTFEILSGGTIIWQISGSTLGGRTIQYQKNDGNWTNITATTAGTQIAVSAGDVVRFRGNNKSYSVSGSFPYHNFFGATCQFEIKGNIMSLIDSTGFETATTLQSAYTFYNFFRNCTGLTSAENLVFPATTLTTSCYYQMFYGCTSLTTAPSLLATTLAEYCYNSMFGNCTSLTTAPELPATTLAKDCYNSMFYNCTSLTTAPALPATTLADWCYDGMFHDCTSLTTAPELPATSLANSCYRYMFWGCTNLNYIKCLATDISATNCTYNWLLSVNATGTFVKDSAMSSWTTGNSGIPDNWTVVDAS